MKTRPSLFDEIKEFQRDKARVIPLLVVFGVIGLFLPILPGLGLLFLGYLLIFPRQGEALVQKIRQFLGLRKEI